MPTPEESAKGALGPVTIAEDSEAQRPVGTIRHNARNESCRSAGAILGTGGRAD